MDSRGWLNVRNFRYKGAGKGDKEGTNGAPPMSRSRATSNRRTSHMLEDQHEGSEKEGMIRRLLV